MKKIIFTLILINFLFGDNLNFYTFSLKENYKEFVYGNVADKDYNSFGDMYGIGIEYEKYFQNIIFSLNGEYSSGKKIYDGAYQDGTPFKTNVNNSYLYNLNAAVDFRPYYIKIGYRFWNRGCSNASGDYNEQYYWSYIASGMDYRFMINKLFIKTDFQYQYAFNPKLKIYLGNNPTVNLGNTSGFMGKIDIGYSFDENKIFGVFYKYDLWHINASNNFKIILNNKNYTAFEPESYTRNQYLGIYYKIYF